MTPMFRNAMMVSGAALAAALSISATAHAQSKAYDGYCYVERGGSQTSAPCLNGEYYAYTGDYKPAPRAPDGYAVEYFTHRPSSDKYDQVYNASTLTQNFDPGAENHFNDRADAQSYGNGSQADSGQSYGGQSYNDHASGYDTASGAQADSSGVDDHHYYDHSYDNNTYAYNGANTQGQADPGAYSANNGYDDAQTDDAQSDSQYDRDGDDRAAGDRDASDRAADHDTPYNPSYGSGQYAYDPQNNGYSRDQYYADNGRAADTDDERPGAINADGYGSDAQVSADRYDSQATGSGNGVTGWRDDQGKWHPGRPAAYGWRDAQGRWHEGQFQASGWRDTQGNWHQDTPESH